jgi:hypothetical protein
MCFGIWRFWQVCHNQTTSLGWSHSDSQISFSANGGQFF